MSNQEVAAAGRGQRSLPNFLWRRENKSPFTVALGAIMVAEKRSLFVECCFPEADVKLSQFLRIFAAS